MAAIIFNTFCLVQLRLLITFNLLIRTSSFLPLRP